MDEKVYKGNRAEAKAISVLSGMGYEVFNQVGEGSKIDLIGVRNQEMLAFQVKTARKDGGSIRVPLATRGFTRGKRTESVRYANIDVFLAYWEGNLYWIDDGEVENQKTVYLRVDPIERQTRKSRMAEDYRVNVG